MSTIEVCLIGNGISSYYFLFLLNNLAQHRKFKIKWIYSDKLFPRVDSGIWPIITLNGVQVGVNSLGDLLFESYHHFRNVNSLFPFASKVTQYMLCDDTSASEIEKFIRRHGNKRKMNFFDQNFCGLALSSFFKARHFFQMG